MTYERWQDICESVKSKFKVQAEAQEPSADGHGHVEFLEFSGPLGEMRLELAVRPRVKDVKTIYSKRMGSQSTVQYEYDDSVHTLTLHVFRRSTGGDWQEIKTDDLLRVF
ncbi:MAG: hypothetical protein HY973_01275 [Candidatus Kerfeldbacteria bacterium]|nr:hypothetical protein [Candidatus Kerfeldbacteria bacterium]